MKAMLNEITLHSKQLIESFGVGSEKENKEIEYLQLQRKAVEEEQQILKDLSAAVNERVSEMQ